MGKLLILLSYLGSPDVGPRYQEAFNYSRRAVLSYKTLQDDAEEIQELQRKAELAAYRFFGLNKEDVAHAMYLYPIYTGIITTKPFPNVKASFGNWTIRPEFEWKFRDDRQFSVFIGASRSF